jgi:pimeloyl-ACP methyl ester carboxylesterase/predicted glycosyltransferase
MTITGTAREQTRARYPDRTGYAERDGVRIFWEEYGDGEPTLLFVPGFSLAHARLWKGQVAYFARHARVITYDGRGNGRSDRPTERAAYTDEQFAGDILAVLDATGTDRAVLVAISAGCQWSLLATKLHPDRVERLCLIGPGVGGDIPPTPVTWLPSFDEPRETYEGWEKFNRHYMMQDFAGFAEWFGHQAVSEPHSTKAIEDGVGWALETTPEVIAAAVPEPGESVAADLDAPLPCPGLIVVGSEDRITPAPIARGLAEKTGASLLEMAGAGHVPCGRHPVRFNLALRDFAIPRPPYRRTWTRALSRQRSALFVSSPIGLGHAWRDVAIARELRSLVPDLRIDWLAQEPVTRVLEAEGERIHPASTELASEVAHFDSESAGHGLYAFEAFRRMDEILLANFMVFHDLVEDEQYDVWIGDEAWDIDYFLHENPECKRAAYVWLTDFVGVLPMPEGGEREQFLVADTNAEMIEQVERFPRVRDRAIFIGAPEDIVPERFGPGLPDMRAWTEAHYTCVGYVVDPRPQGERDSVEADRVCVVTAGGSGAGEELLRLAIDAYPAAAERVPGLRMVVVAGPRIDPGTLPAVEGVDTVGYVHDLQRLLSACGLAIVHGGLATTMELTAAGRPFLYFPLKSHFEQRFHVQHRLQRHGAGRPMEIDETTPETLADAIASEIGGEVRYKPIAPGGARRAAELIAELL